MTSRHSRTSGRLRERVLRFGIWLLLLLVAVEVALRLSGWALLAIRARQSGAISEHTDAIRILHLGESTTFGLGVAPEEAYPAVVAELLQKRHPGRSFVSINRGVPGLVTSAMLRTLDEKLALVRPTLVTVMAGANDVNEELNGDSFRRGVLSQEATDLLSSLRLYKAGWLLLQLLRPDVRLDHGEVIYYHHGGSKNILYDTPRDERKVADITNQLEENLRRIVRDCRRGALVVLVGYIQAYEENRILMRVASESGVPYVSTYLEPEARQPALFTSDGWHPSALGHRHIAETIAEAIDPLLTAKVQTPDNAQK